MSAPTAKRSLAPWVETTRPAIKMVLSRMSDKDRDTPKKTPKANLKDLNAPLGKEIAFSSAHSLSI
ncbi:MAG: hypothetical protein Q8R67_07455 [Rhodoferax sp.]|nr:hypothetical protein [Rhodoferax sp.]MDP3651502.1 hypothetical protein [Rhodoferax sp.]